MTKLHQNPSANKTRNLNLRIAPEPRDLLDRAAKASGKTLTDFVLDAATQAAEQALLDQCFFSLQGEEFEKFIKQLDEPVETPEKLSLLLKRKPLWE